MRKILSVVLSFGLLFQQSGLLYAAGEINLANYLSQAKSAIVQPDQFRPPQLRYISYDVKSNDFKLLLDKGGAKLNELSNSLNSSTPKLNNATQELFNYFLIGLSLPNDTFWVNLRPDAPENIIDPLLEKTDIGKIFLEADLQLKKDTASLTSPQNPEGKAYWDKLYKKAGELFGTENITIPTITRPWIVPNEVIVRETDDSAYIYKATLKVMLEADYLQNQKTEKPKNERTEELKNRRTQGYGFSDPRLKELNEYSSQIIRETIIPKLTKEINSSKRYAQLRQVYYSLVLARWFKQKYSSPGSISAPESQSTSSLASSYISLIDSGNLANLASQEPCDKQDYFQAYQKSFKDGEYNLKETVATPFGQSIRSYISGGLHMKFGAIGADSPITGIKVPNRTDVTETLTGLPPATIASPLEFDRVVNDINKIGWDVMDKVISFNDPWRHTFEMQFSSKSEEQNTASLKGIYEKDKVKFQTIARDYYRLLTIIILQGLENKELARVESIFRENIFKHASLGKGFENAVNKTEFIKQMLNNIAVTLFMNNDVEDSKLLLLADVAYSYIHNSESEEAFPAGSPLTVEQIKHDIEVRVSPTRYQYGSASFGNEFFTKLANDFSAIKDSLDSKEKIIKWLENVLNKLESPIGEYRFYLNGLQDKEAYDRTTIELRLLKESLVYETKQAVVGSPVIGAHLSEQDRADVGYLADATSNILEAMGADFKNKIISQMLAEIPRKVTTIVQKKFVKEYNADENGSKNIYDLLGDSLEVIEFFVELEFAFPVDFSEDDMKGISSVNGAMDYLNRHMKEFYNTPLSDKLSQDLYKEELLDFLKQACRIGVVDLLDTAEKSGVKINIAKIQKNVKEDKIIDATQALFDVFSIAKGYGEKAGICQTIINAWKMASTAGSPLTIKQFKDKASKILRDLGNDFLEESIRMEYIKGRKNLIKYTRQSIYKIERKIKLAISNKNLSLEFADKNSALMAQEFKREGKIFNLRADFVETNALEKEVKRHSSDARRYSEDIIDLKSAKKSLVSLIKAFSSSSLTNIESVSSRIPGSDLKKSLGGIDLTDRMLKIKLERVGSFASSALVLPEINNMDTLDLDKEFEQIQAMVSSSIRPSDTRILEFAAACYYRGEFDQRLTQVSSCIKSAHLADEISGRDSSEALRLATMLPDALYGG